MAPTHAQPLDPAKRDAFVDRFVVDLGAAVHLATVILGDRLGLFQAMASGEPVTAAELADRTGTSVANVERWLTGQAAAGYVEHDPTDRRFRLPAEHADVLLGGRSAVFIPGAFQVAASIVKDEPMLTEAFRTGQPVVASRRHPDCYVGAERWSRADYAAHLVLWLAASDDVSARMQRGAAVADVGCGHGVSTTVMAAAYPASTLVGFDERSEAVEVARVAAAAAGVGARVRFEVAAPDRFPGSGYGLVTCIDGFTSMPDPVAVASRVCAALAPDGAWLIVEPSAAESDESPMAKVLRNLAAVTGGLGLGAGEDAVRSAVLAGGFRSLEAVAQTPGHTAYLARG